MVVRLQPTGRSLRPWRSIRIAHSAIDAPTNLNQRSAGLLSTILLVSALLASACSSPPREPSPTPTEATGAEQVSACLADKGWEIVDASAGEARVPPEQFPLYNEDLESCSLEVMGDADSSPLNDVELADLYVVEVAVADCLSGLGHQVEVPTLQAFIDSYHSELPFTAYAQLPSMGRQDWEQTNEECPQAGEIYRR